MFKTNVSDTWSDCDYLFPREDLNHNDFADDVAGAKKGMDLHNEAKKKIHKIPVENIDAMGQRLLQRLVSFCWEMLLSTWTFDSIHSIGSPPLCEM